MELDLVRLARDLVRADTVSDRGNGAATDLLAPLWQSLGWEVSRHAAPHSTPSIRQENLLARAPSAPASGEGLLLVTHLDTVDPGPRAAWRHDPWELGVEGDVLTGLGVADVKVDSLCKLIAASRLGPRRLTRPLAFMGTFEEEVGCKGAKAFAAAPLFPARFVMCGEPSELRLIDAHKGYAVATVVLEDRQPERLAGPFRRLHVAGKSAHSSTPHLGLNAITLAGPQLAGQRIARIRAGSVANKVAADLEALLQDEAGEVALEGAPFDLGPLVARSFALAAAWEQACIGPSPSRDERFDPPTCVVNQGVLRSLDDGTARITATFDSRLLPGQSPEALFARFEQAVVAQRNERFHATFTIERSNGAMALSPPSQLLDAAQAASRAVGLNPVPHAKPTNTEAGVFAGAGYEALVFGPGVSTGNAHTANERQLLSQCRQAIDFYEALMLGLCG